MRFSTMTELSKSRNFLETFYGYNHNLRIREGEFFEMENMTSDHYPVLSPRLPRKHLEGMAGKLIDHVVSIMSKDGLTFVWKDGDTYKLRYKNTDYPLSSDIAPTQLVSMGAYIIAFPNGEYLNTSNTSDRGTIKWSIGFDAKAFEYCKEDGTAYTDIPTTKPEEPEDGAVWLEKIPGKGMTIYEYADNNGMWYPITRLYLKVYCNTLTNQFKEGDSLRIILNSDSPLVKPGKYWTDNEDYWKNNYFPVHKIYINNEDHTKDYIMFPVTRYIPVGTGSKHIILDRSFPEMDFVLEANNRLWGCKYGTITQNGETKFVNELYACKLGDFKNWYSFQGTSMDSYVASIGTDGPFTGATVYMGYPYFFKENHLHKVYGSYPAQFQVQTTSMRGVEKWSERSLAIVDGVLFFKSIDGISIYDGSMPKSISSQFGRDKYHDAIGCEFNGKYYVSMVGKDNIRSLFVYDPKVNAWHREDSLAIDSMVNVSGRLYYLVDGKIYEANEGDEETVNWSVETGLIGDSLPDRKTITDLTVRMKLALGSRVFFYIQYDSMGEWHHVATIVGKTLNSFPISIRPRRCDHFKMRIVGEGDAKIYSIAKTIEGGSDKR